MIRVDSLSKPDIYLYVRKIKKSSGNLNLNLNLLSSDIPTQVKNIEYVYVYIKYIYRTTRNVQHTRTISRY